MKIKLLTAIGIDGTSHAKDSIVEVSQEMAIKLLSCNKAVAAKAKAKK